MHFTLDLKGVNTVEFKYFCQSFSLQLILYIYVNIYFTIFNHPLNYKKKNTAFIIVAKYYLNSF